MRKLILHIILLSGFLTTAQQGIADTCLDDLKKINADMGKILNPEGRKAYRLVYTVDVQPWDVQSGYVPTQKIEILMSKDQIHYYANGVRVVQDHYDSFMVMEAQRTIIRNRSVTFEDKNAMVAKTVAMRDSIFNLCRLVDCREVQVNGKNMQKAKLVPNSYENQSRLGIVSTEITYQKETNWIEKVVINYGASGEVKQMVYNYQVLDYSYKESLSKPAAELFVNKNNQLHKKYAGYKYVDQR